METDGNRKTDILFVIPPYHKRNGSGSIFPLGISSIIAYLEAKGYTYEYVDCAQIINTLRDEDLSILDNKLPSILEKCSPLLVGIGPCVTPGAKGLQVVTKRCVERFGQERVFAGGPFALLPSQDWFFFETLGLKYIIKGDGEEATFKAIETLKAGKALSECDAISTKSKSVVNTVRVLDALPFPKRLQMDKDVFSERRKLETTGKTAYMVASRGCPYNCAYCVSGNLETKFRRRTAGNVVKEMNYLQEAYGVTDIVFYDDCFFMDSMMVHRELKDFCDALDDIGIHMTWQIEIRPDVLMVISDEEFKKLSGHGCRQMNIGVEKTYFDGAGIFGKRFDYSKLRTHIAHIHDVSDISLTGTFILGGKGETVESVRTLIKESADMNLDKVEYSPLFVYPDTPIYKEIFGDPREWLEVVLKEEEPWGEVVYESDLLTKNTLIEMVDEAYTFFYRNGPAVSRKIMDRYNLKG